LDALLPRKTSTPLQDKLLDTVVIASLIGYRIEMGGEEEKTIAL
jgi:hypothetical protein